MKQKITTEQRKLIAELLEQGEDRHVIAQRASVTVGQVSALQHIALWADTVTRISLANPFPLLGRRIVAYI